MAVAIALQTLNEQWMMTITTPPLAPVDLAVQFSAFTRRLTSIRHEHGVESELLRRGSVVVENYFVSYSLLRNEVYITVWLASNANPFLGAQIVQNVVNLLKPLCKSRDTLSVLIDKTYFDVHWGLSRILEGLDVSRSDISRDHKCGAFFHDVVEKTVGFTCNHTSLLECSEICHPTATLFQEPFIEVDDLELEASTTHHAPLDSQAVLNEVKKEAKGAAAQTDGPSIFGMPSLESLGDQFIFANFNSASNVAPAQQQSQPLTAASHSPTKKI